MADLTGQNFGLPATFGQVLTKGTTGQLFQDGTGAGVTCTLQTFSPTFKPATGSFTTMTYNTTTGGSYLKIAENLIYFNLRISTDNVDITGASGLLSIICPFTSSVARDQPVSVGFAIRMAAGSTDNVARAILQASSNKIVFEISTSVAVTSQSYLDTSDLKTGVNSAHNIIVVSGIVNATI